MTTTDLLQWGAYHPRRESSVLPTTVSHGLASTALEETGIQETVVPIVGMGHALNDYKQIIDDNNVQMIVLDTQDEDQLAMRGMAYALAVEIQDRPLLLL